MTEEIKEILEYYQKDIDKFEYYMSDYNDEQLKTTFSKNYQRYKNHKILLNYITNLQKENQSLKEKLNCKEYFSSTMPENTEFVILTKENYDRQQKDLALENITLKSRNEKAVEYIKNIDYFDGEISDDIENIPFKYAMDTDIDELLNILQGGDE